MYKNILECIQLKYRTLFENRSKIEQPKFVHPKVESCYYNTCELDSNCERRRALRDVVIVTSWLAAHPCRRSRTHPSRRARGSRQQNLRMIAAHLEKHGERVRGQNTCQYNKNTSNTNSYIKTSKQHFKQLSKIQWHHQNYTTKIVKQLLQYLPRVTE